jgi:hypothetical protein
VAITQIGRLGQPEWRSRVGYGDRAHVEGAWSAVKRTLGHRSRTRSFAGVSAEIVTRVNVYNGWLMHEHGTEALAAA